MSEVGSFCRMFDVDGGWVDLVAEDYERLKDALEARECLNARDVFEARLAAGGTPVLFPMSCVRYVYLSTPGGREAAHAREEAIKDELKEREPPEWLQ